MKIKNLKPVCRQARLKIIRAVLSVSLVVPCYLFLVTCFSAPVFAQNALVNYGPTNTPIVTQNPKHVTLQQLNQKDTRFKIHDSRFKGKVSPTPSPKPQLATLPQSWGICSGLANALSYVFTLGNTVKLDHPQQSFSPAVKPSFTLDIPISDKTNVGKSKTNTWQTTDEVIQAKLVSKTNGSIAPAVIEKQKSGKFLVTVAKTEGMMHGDYTLSVAAKESIVYTRDLTQDFSWGVIAVNTNKSIYKTGEKTHLMFGVVDKDGNTVCNAQLSITISDPQGKQTTLSTQDGNIKHNPDCSGSSVTYAGDYYTDYQTTTEGQYGMHVTATTRFGTHSLDDYFVVKDNEPFVVERSKAPSRIYPASAYDMQIKITANQDYQGPVEDFAPKGLKITNVSDNGTIPDQPTYPMITPSQAVLDEDQQAYGYLPKRSALLYEDTHGEIDHTPMPIIWNVNWQKGHTYTLSYTLNYPPVSPEFYLVGPFQVGTTSNSQQPLFQEARQWQSATDANKCWIGSAGGNWSVNGNWQTTAGGGTTAPGSSDVAYFDPSKSTCTSASTTNTNSTIDASYGGSVQGINIQSAYTQTITNSLTGTLSIGSSGYSQAGGNFSGGTHAITDANTFTVSGGTFTSTTGTITANGAWNTTGGTFAANGGIVKFNGTFTITPSSETYNNVTIDNSGNCSDATYTMAASTTLTVSGTLTLTDNDSCGGSTIINGTGGISAQGNVSLTSVRTVGYVRGTVVITINGSGTQNITGVSSGNNGDGSTPSININASGTVNFQNVITEDNDWTYTAGTVTYTGSTIVFNAFQDGAEIITPGSTAFNAVSFENKDNCNNATYTMAASTTLTVSGTLTLADHDGCGKGTFINGTGGISAQGNISLTALHNVGIVQGSVVITINGSGTQNITGVSSGVFDDATVPSLIINSSGTVNIQNAITEVGDWTYIAGTVSYTGSTVNFDAIQNQSSTITPSSTAFNNVTINSSSVPCAGSQTYTIASGTTLTVAGTLTLSDTTGGCGGATHINGTGGISAQGDINLNQASTSNNVDGTVVVTINGTGTQTMTGISSGGADTGTIPSVNINKPSGTLNIRNTINETNDWTWTQGIVDYTGSKVYFEAEQDKTSTITPGATAFNDVDIDNSGYACAGTQTYTIASGSTLTVAGTLTFDDTTGGCGGNTNVNGTGTIAAQGNVTTNSANIGGNVPIILTGSSSQSITQSSTNTFPTGNWTINKSGGTATLASALTLNASGQQLTVANGTLDLAGQKLIMNANSTIGMTGGTIKLQGAEYIPKANTSFIGGTVNYYGSGTYAKMDLGTNYYNLTISGSGSWTAATASAVLGSFAISAGTYTAPSTLTIGGGFSNSGGVFTQGTNAVIFNDNTQTSTITGANNFYDFTITTPGKIIAFPASTTTTVTHSLTLQGTPQGRVSLRSSSPGTQATLTASGSYSVNALDVQDSNVCASAVEPIAVTASINSGNNSCWNFSGPQQAWYNTSWLYRKEIIINHNKVPADQTNFPVLITWSSDSSVQAHTQSNGNDILFTSSDGVTKLLHEIETYNSGTGELEAWVKVPTLSSTVDTVLWMYYGNAGASNQQASPISSVWSDNYIGVWHLQQSAAGYPTLGEFVDSFGVNNLTAGQNTQKPTRATGQISFGQSFTSASTQIASNSAISANSLNNVNSTKTVSLWYKVTTNPGAEQVLFSLQNTNDSSGDQIEFQNGTTFRISNATPSTLVSISDPAASVWHKVDWTWNGSTNILYIDGQQANTSSTAPQNATATVIALGDYWLGTAGTKPFNGSLDEVRIANTNLSAQWIQTEYNNQSSPSTFESFVKTPFLQFGHGVKINHGVSIHSS